MIVDPRVRQGRTLASPGSLSDSGVAARRPGRYIALASEHHGPGEGCFHSASPRGDGIWRGGELARLRRCGVPVVDFQQKSTSGAASGHALTQLVAAIEALREAGPGFELVLSVRPSTPPDEAMTLRELARLRGVVVGTVRRWVSEGVRGVTLRTVRRGGRSVVLRNDLEAWDLAVDAQRSRGVPPVVAKSEAVGDRAGPNRLLGCFHDSRQNLLAAVGIAPLAAARAHPRAAARSSVGREMAGESKRHRDAPAGVRGCARAAAFDGLDVIERNSNSGRLDHA